MDSEFSCLGKDINRTETRGKVQDKSPYTDKYPELHSFIYSINKEILSP